ncbi:sugar ABC transporter ATP-binding protein [Caldifermentibacillus hisashii]|uniref:sugar ABC transporter ATP-binding protein n=1 Tax=Caldifermentibacillus hisashii TaxID=996558 RepID=UPI001C1011F5|nr:sugar ABC transporter ATP-binding protein [Caldifermentibacillus hisashii]MBU5342127.1 sugar ABC transporter ATP-binding protein [Caldifermentibacillus hisashii]
MNILEMENINKSFNGVPVLKDVNFSVEKGEIHALLGENGAGKSTLMNILTGVIPLDSGEVIFEGEHIENQAIKKRQELGIAFVHQELNLFNDLKVYENIFLGKEYVNRFGTLKKKEMIQKSKELFERLRIEIDPTAEVSTLKVSEKQLLEISKSLFFSAKLLILDEPTTALSNDEIEHLFIILRRLRDEGKSIIFISHKMPEIFTISDRYTVLRNGMFIQSGKITDATPEEVTRLLVGASYSTLEIYQKRKLGNVVLELKKFSGEGFKKINLTVRKGEILGLTGLKGSGSSELMNAIFGTQPAQSGSIFVFDKPIKNGSIHVAMKAKMALLPSNRKENSVIPDMSLLENMYVAEHTLSALNFHINYSKELNKFYNYKEMLGIKCNKPSYGITSLSGGNQQKVFLARWLNTEADILLLDNPTQGIDVGAKAEIYKLILNLAEQGKTILINTLEIPELQKIADRCAVFYNGEIIKILQHDEIDEETVMMYSTQAIGGHEDGENQ